MQFDKYETLFINSNNHRGALMALSLEFICESYDLDERCACDYDLRGVIQKVLLCLSNIFLNNYIKMKNNANNAKKSSKRKLSCLT
mgnify:CR=1 FL=1